MDHVLNQTPLIASQRILREMIADGRLPAQERVPTEAILAERAGVSRFTVHRALEALADEGLLERSGKRGWTVAAGAGAPTGALANTIGVLGGEFDLTSLARRGTQAQHLLVYAGARQTIQQAGMDALAIHADRISTTGIDELRAAGLHRLLVLLDCSDQPAIRRWLAEQARNGVHVVLHSDRAAPAGCHSVTSDHSAGGAAIVRALHQRGYRHPLRIHETTPGRKRHSEWVAARDAGHEQACAELGMTVRAPEQLLVPESTLGQDNAEGFEIKVRLAEHVLAPLFASDSAPDALIGMADRNLFYIAAALQRLGLRPNQDVALIGYDATWNFCIEQRFQPLIPALTVNKREHTIGERMVALLRTPPAAPTRELIAPCVIEPQG
ncbi:MAG: GntR family transcriptional regulator [Planctomycetota bacterium]|jgi:DNA-binding LacI/PurR family transcriptional regulator|nr:GntR family transcriptional regulator [Planctomycetota bacterium]